MSRLYVKYRAEWRTWLEKRHSKCDEVWLVYYKKSSGKPRIAYEDAVEEALCFGWIDGKIRKIDEACYEQRFTPRRPRSFWNRSNIQRAERLIELGKMTPAGPTVFQHHRSHETPSLPTEIPKDLEAKFRKRSTAWKNFQGFPKYYRRMTIGWVAGAKKKEETRLSRLKRLIAFSMRGERIKFM